MAGAGRLCSHSSSSSRLPSCPQVHSWGGENWVFGGAESYLSSGPGAEGSQQIAGGLTGQGWRGKGWSWAAAALSDAGGQRELDICPTGGPTKVEFPEPPPRERLEPHTGKEP